MYSSIKQKDKDRRYPCLMKDWQGNVYLMRAYNEGTLVFKEPEAILHTGMSTVGDFCWTLDASDFRSFVGEIILGETS